MKRAKHRVFPAARTGRTAELLAAGSVCVLLANPATAVELGDIEIDSVLGQPLRASIAFALGPNERLADDCVYLRAAAPAGGLPAVTRGSATVSGQRLVLRGDTPLREPMMSLQVVVDCPYTARLRRDYLLLLNPPALAAATDRVAARPAPRVAPAITAAAATPRAERPRPTPAAPATPIAAGQDYRVRPGDTLSGIASRISDRSVGLWPAIEQIFAANPAAFPDGDIDRLPAGATLRIPPGLTANAPATTLPAEAGGVAFRGAGSAPALANSEGPPPRIEYAAATPAGASLPPAEAPGAAAAPSIREAAGENADGAAATTTTVALRAAAPYRDAPDRPEATDRAPQPETAAVDAREAAAPQPEFAAAAPSAAEPIPLAGDADSPAQSWLVWLGGGGIAIFLALLIFGRRLRERFDEGDAVAPGRNPDETADRKAPRGRRSTDRRGAGHDGEADDDTDFDTGEDLDVALDFSFASSGEFSSDLDFIVEESQITAFPPADIGAALDDDLAPTQEMPARETGAATEDIASVTDRFPPPGKRPKDLETIEVEALDSRPRPGPGLDLTSEFDYEVLEQDYEEELTATHALAVDIEQAARDLQLELGEFDDDEGRVSMADEADGSAEATAAMPAEMLPPRADSNKQDNGEDTDINEIPTSRLPQSDETVEMDTDATVEHRSKTG